MEKLRKEGEDIGLNFPLLPTSADDKVESATIIFGKRVDAVEQMKKRKIEIKATSIFNTKEDEKLKKVKIEALKNFGSNMKTTSVSPSQKWKMKIVPIAKTNSKATKS
jgi:hypothetical protein